MSDLLIIDGIGFAAAGLVLATFCMHSMSALRWVAIASNVAFIAYGYLEHLAPVLLLHVLLLPVNSYRLAQLYGVQARSKPTKDRSKHLLAPSNCSPFVKPTLEVSASRSVAVARSWQEMKSAHPGRSLCAASKAPRYAGDSRDSPTRDGRY